MKARIATISGFSGHAGQSELVRWFDSLAGSRPRLAIPHGEEDSRAALAAAIGERYGIEPILPAQNDVIELWWREDDRAHRHRDNTLAILSGATLPPRR